VAAVNAEAPRGRLVGASGRAASWLATGLALYALYWVVGIVEAHIYRTSFLLVCLVLTFLLYGARSAPRTRVGATDWLLVGAAVAGLGWPLVDPQFFYRAATPRPVDVALGILTIGLVLEATRRTVGWVLPAVAGGFLAYALAGPWLGRVGLGLVAHRGYDVPRLVGALYQTLEGLFGVPLDVAATYIVLFAIYGAVLEASGAGQFFIDWALAATGRARSGAGPGRTVTLAGFLLGTVSGSGVATTVTLGSVAWPLLRAAGYEASVGGAILSAAGIGAILSPPTLGAAAFLIAEFLQITYLRVLVMATVPTLLYYLSIVLMIEGDARRLKARPVATDAPSVWTLTRREGYHFVSLVAIAALMAAGLTAFRAVFWATVLAVATGLVARKPELAPGELAGVLERGATSILPVAATTATAGLIVGVVTLTGLGLKMAGLIVALADGRVFLTVVYAAVAVWLLGLAVPVTASYIIAAVMVAPALTAVGISPLAAHMFIFYYAVLSEVSPPTALSPLAAAALTGGDPFRTMMRTWKYTLPAFLVPFAFSLTPEGLGLLLQAPLGDILRASTSAVAGVAALAAALTGWLGAPLTRAERLGSGVAGLLLCYPDGRSDAAGLGALALIGAAYGYRKWRHAATDR